MATKIKSDISVEEKLRALYDLQIIDSRLDEIRNTRGELPMEVEDLDAEIAGLEKRVTKFNAEITELQDEISNKKESIKNSESSIKKYVKQQDNVRNNREFESLAKEIEFQELEIQLAEKRIKEFSAKIEQKNSLIADLNDKLASLKNHLKHKKDELDTLIKETEKEEQFLLKKSDEFAKLIDERLMKSYNRLRSNSKNGLAVVSIERGAAKGSFFTIPPQRQMEIATRKKVMTDEHSGKILVDEFLAKEEVEKMEKLLN